MKNLSSSDVIAVLAIIVSLGSAFYQWYLDSYTNKINLEAEYFKELFLDHLIEKIPKARTYIRFQNGRLTDIDRLVEELKILNQKSLFYKYWDRNFYANLKSEVQGLEDYLIETADSPLTFSEQNKAMDEIQRKLEVIYSILGKKYIGKK